MDIPTILENTKRAVRATAGGMATHPSIQAALAALDGVKAAGASARGSIAALNRRNDVRPYGLCAPTGPTAAGQTICTITLPDNTPNITRLFLRTENLVSIDAVSFDNAGCNLGVAVSSVSVTGAGAAVGNGTLPGYSIDQSKVMLAAGFVVPKGTKTISITVTTASGAAVWGAYLLGMPAEWFKLCGDSADGE